MKVRTVNIYGLLLVFFAAICTVACQDDKEDSEQPQRVYPLVFDQDSFEIRKGIPTRLDAVSCNGYNVLDLEVGDAAMLESRTYIIENSTSHASGWIELIGLQKGLTSLAISDRIVKEKVVLNIKITDSYLGMQNRGTNHPLFLDEDAGFLFLIDNEHRDFYLFGTKNQEPSDLGLKGTYLFSVENQIPNLTLTVLNDENQSVDYKFDLSENNAKVHAILNNFFHLNWGKIGDKETKSIDNTVYLHMKEVGTDAEVSFAITDPKIPEGILN